jgi:hypothetical protein
MNNRTTPTASTPLEAAREYLSHHRLPITLCRTGEKKPFPNGWADKKWTLPDIDRAFQKCSNLNVGTRLGPAAGIIDFDADSDEAERDLLELFQRDVPVTPTWISFRGQHRLFAWDPRLAAIGAATMHFGALEVRLGTNNRAAHSLLPPSVTDDQQRTWLVSLDECAAPNLPDDVVHKLLQLRDKRRRASRKQERHTPCPESSELSASSVSSESSVSSVFPAVQIAIAATLPTARGQRHRKIFEFARHLKAIPELSGADAQFLRRFVEEWHRQALPFIATKPFEETWLDFCEGWDKVKFAAGSEPIAALFAQAMRRGTPACAEWYEQPQVRSLVALCRELQKLAGESAFFLDCRTAGRLLSVEHKVAWRWLRLLIREDVLQVVSVGTRHRASEYRYLGD